MMKHILLFITALSLTACGGGGGGGTSTAPSASDSVVSGTPTASMFTYDVETIDRTYEVESAVELTVPEIIEELPPEVETVDIVSISTGGAEIFTAEEDVITPPADPYAGMRELKITKYGVQYSFHIDEAQAAALDQTPVDLSSKTWVFEEFRATKNPNICEQMGYGTTYPLVEGVGDFAAAPTIDGLSLTVTTYIPVNGNCEVQVGNAYSSFDTELLDGLSPTMTASEFLVAVGGRELAFNWTKQLDYIELTEFSDSGITIVYHYIDDTNVIADESTFVFK